jgi:hypothetical protein
MAAEGERWIRFLRQYGPIPRNENMFDEHIRRSASRLGVRPISFKHPLEDGLLAAFGSAAQEPRSAVLTGTAGDGKSHLCGRVWESLGGSKEAWSSDEIYFQMDADIGGRRIALHVIRDLTALPETDSAGRYADKSQLLERMSKSLFSPAPEEIFLLAANDGQLIEAWRRSETEPTAARARAMFEARLMNEADHGPEAKLEFFNLSTVPSATVFDLAAESLLSHESWAQCYEEQQQNRFFGSRCPIRRNYELLRTPLVRSRLRNLFELCDFNELHTPIRRVLMLLANAILGHPNVKDRLMLPRDVRDVVEKDTGYLASIYSNLFGANLIGTKRESLEIFEYLGRFGIGHETTNRIDNILIFGAEDEKLLPYYQSLMVEDVFYGATDRFRAAQHDYVEGPEAASGDQHVFLDMLVEQRRALFFKIPDDLAEELKLWHTTVFMGAGEFLKDVAIPLRSGQQVSRKVVERLVKGLNRIFTGMLVATERELLLATSLSLSSARVSQLLEDRIPVRPRGRESIEVTMRRGFPSLDVHLPEGQMRSLRLNLTRYEFLMRVSNGALPGNFSRECYEDTRLSTRWEHRCRLCGCPWTAATSTA